MREAPEPELRPGTLLVDVKAAGCNFFDILMVAGQVPGEAAVPVRAGRRGRGRGARGRRGRRRLRRRRPRARLVRARRLRGAGRWSPRGGAWRLPDGMSFAEGAALPIVYPTSYAGLVYRGRAPGGRDAARARRGGRRRRRRGADRQGARRARDRDRRRRRQARGRAARGRRRRDRLPSEDFVARVKEATGGRGADVIYDSVGGDVFERSLKCIAWNGRLLVIGFAGGASRGEGEPHPAEEHRGGRPPLGRLRAARARRASPRTSRALRALRGGRDPPRRSTAPTPSTRWPRRSRRSARAADLGQGRPCLRSPERPAGVGRCRAAPAGGSFRPSAARQNPRIPCPSSPRSCATSGRNEADPKHAAKRAELRKACRTRTLSMDEKLAVQEAFAKLPATRARPASSAAAASPAARAPSTGSSALSRIMLRELALRGELPGVRKSSW